VAGTPGFSSPYLGTEGTLVGVDYSKALFPLFGFMSDEDLQAKETWPTDWVAEASAWFDTPVPISKPSSSGRYA
jgi:hypothetical protein